MAEATGTIPGVGGGQQMAPDPFGGNLDQTPDPLNDDTSPFLTVNDDDLDGEIVPDSVDGVVDAPQAQPDDIFHDEFGDEVTDPDRIAQLRAEQVDPNAQAQAQASKSEIPDETLLEMADGTQVSIKDLQGGYLRQQDYTQKTQAVADERRGFETVRGELNNDRAQLKMAQEAIVSFVQNAIPPVPDPELMRSNPQEYNYQLAVRQQVTQELQGLMQNTQGAFVNQQQQGTQSQKDYEVKEARELLSVFPQLATPEKMQTFRNGVQTTARTFGFNDDEIAATHDHRILQLVHYASIGKRALQNRTNAQRRVSTQRLPGRPQPANLGGNRNNRAAMDRLGHSGSLEDAMGIDFE